jgi:two-component system cell cycle sensor histidine kinase/response regulator CckA
MLVNLSERRQGKNPPRSNGGAGEPPQYGSLLENLSIGVFRLSFGGRVLAANTALATMLGYSDAEQLSASNGAALADSIGLSALELRQRLEREGEFRGLETTWRRRDGATLSVRINARTVRDPENPARVLYFEGTLEDVTERRRTEEKLRERTIYLHALIENSPLAIVVLNSQRMVEMCNRAFTRIFGFRQRELTGRDLDALLAPGESSAEARRLSEQAFSGENIHTQTRRRRRDGQWIDVELFGVPVVVDGRQVGALGIYQDITERKELEQQLAQAQKMDAIGRLAGGVAHDFNNLLMVISGYAELLVDHFPADHPGRHQAEEIKRAADRATALTRQLLTFSRKQVRQPRPLGVDQAVREMEQLLRRLIPENVEIACRPDAEGGEVHADPTQFQQVLMNLAVNAADAMPNGGRLVLETRNVTLDDHFCRRQPDLLPGLYVMLTVADTGCGMDAATCARAFEPFFTTKEPGEGTGLGLATVYGIVKQSNGHITVESEPGRGSIFRIYLPRLTEAAEPAPAEAPHEALPRASETVLLVEDEDTVCEITRAFLLREGYHVLTASDGQQALRLARLHPGPIHLLLTDVVMPGMGGRDLAAHLTALRPEMRVLFASGYPQEAALDGATPPGNGRFIQKPFELRTLAEVVRSLLTRDDATPAAP